ncbi:hypothetical protein NW766_009581 [Fusarium irregulare]|uniref:Uncharacterized protein n=1 Tax=Fusarium irregulare TaxID=2494466 RepID=A0A9W8PK64_9HYPO|nr:hypothetical protein NW766_009581 [Fusarium irregulare]
MPRANMETQLKKYLEAANPENLGVPDPIQAGRWTDAHGEGRTASTITFHLRFMKRSDGTFATSIAYQQRGQEITVSDSTKNWGAQVVAADVLKHYQDLYGVTSKEVQKKT